MLKLRAPTAPGLSRGARRLEWVLPLLAACSVYDPSLLGDDRSALTDSGGSSSAAGKPQGGTEYGGGKSGSGGSSASGGEDERGGAHTGGSPASRGGTTNAEGGAEDGGEDTGGNASGGTLTSSGGSAAGGAVSMTGGAGGKGGNPGTGGASTTGGAPSKGGTTATGGATVQGGTLSTGGTTAGAAGAGGSGGDGCPSDPNKTAPGVCGCGVPEQDSGSVAGCLGLRSALVHRYTFAGTGTSVRDSAGTAHGTAVNASQSNGSISLTGSTPDQYVDLPNKLLSTLTNATIEVWTTWSGGPVWQRIFDFGNSTSATEGTRDAGETYLFLSPKTMAGGMKVSYSLSGSANEIAINASAALPSGVVSHVSVVVNDSADQLLLYLNGASAGNAAFSGHLSNLKDINDWLGRSQFTGDAGYAGALHEFRIYNVALSAPQIQLTEQTGPDPAFF